MKKLMTIIAAFLSLSAFADEYIRLEGTFTFSDIKTVQVRDIELVPTQNRARYQELVSLNYQCFIIGEFHKCTKFQKSENLPSDLHQEMMNRYHGHYFHFSQTEMLPSITNEAESIVEWKIYDRVQSSEGSVSEYDYYLLKSDGHLHKIALRFPEYHVWAIINDQKQIEVPMQKRLSAGQFKTRVYELSLVFKK